MVAQSGENKIFPLSLNSPPNWDLLSLSTPVVDVASLSYKTNYFFFFLNVCATEPACEMRMSAVTRCAIKACHNNNEGPIEFCGVHHCE